VYYDIRNWLADIEGKRISGISMELHQSADKQVIRYVSIIIRIHDRSYRIATSSDGETIGIDDFEPKASDMAEYGSIILRDGLVNPCIRPLIDDCISEAKGIFQDSSIIGFSIITQKAMALYVINYNDDLVVANDLDVIRRLLSHFR
jgi:hypothetical protein